MNQTPDPTQDRSTQQPALYAIVSRRQDGRQRILAEFRDPDVARHYADALRAVGDGAEIVLLSAIEDEHDH